MDAVGKGWSFLDMFRTVSDEDVAPSQVGSGGATLEVEVLEREAQRQPLASPLAGSIGSPDEPDSDDLAQSEAAEYLARRGHLTGYCPYCPWATCGSINSTRRNLRRHVGERHGSEREMIDILASGD